MDYCTQSNILTIPSLYHYILCLQYHILLDVVFCAISLWKICYSGKGIKTKEISMLFFGFSHIGAGCMLYFQNEQAHA